MAETLTSVGLDVGTTTTQLIVSRLTVQDRASAFTVPELTITDRQILYESPIHMTPLLQGDLVDGEGIRRIVTAEYESAGIRREDVDTGAVIITGETSRKENAQAVLAALSDYAGDFVVATAGPDLESILAARGSGAVAHTARTGETVLHMDIGGGTSNLAWIRDGKIMATTCLNVGGRLLKFDRQGTLTYVSPALKDLSDLHPGDRPDLQQLEALAGTLTQALEMAAGLRPPTKLLQQLTTKEACPPLQGGCPEGAGEVCPPLWGGCPEGAGEVCPPLWGGCPEGAAEACPPLWGGCPEGAGEVCPPLWGGCPEGAGEVCPPLWGGCPEGAGEVRISFSGGVAECIRQDLPPFTFGDIGPLLGKTIRRSRLCRNYRLGEHTIRATVIGAGCHSAQLSGSTVFHRGITFPLKNLPAIPLDPRSPNFPLEITQHMAAQDTVGVLALPGWPSATYAQTAALADQIAAGIPTGPVLVTVEQDMAKALGQALALRLSPDRPILCLDRLRLTQGSYLDVTAPIGPALPVVIKTLIFSAPHDRMHNA